MGVGTYNYYYWAYGNGTSHNYNVSTIRSYVITKNITGNIITPLLNGNNANLIVVYPQQINASYVLGANKTAVTIKINETAVTIGANYTWGVGGWVVNYSVIVNQNYSAYETYLNATINKADSNVTVYINHTQANATIDVGQSIRLNASLVTGDTGSLVLYNNGTLIQNSTNGTTPLSNLTTFSTIGLYNITAYYIGSQNYSSNWSRDWWVNVTPVSNTAPQITKVFNETYDSGITLSVGPSDTNITINFSVTDAQGVEDLDNATAMANITKIGEQLRQNLSCSQTEADGTNANYSCSIPMYWFDSDGIWNIEAYIKDNSGLPALNDTTTLVVNTLTGFAAGPTPLSFAEINPGSYNNTATNAIILNNTGNQNITAGTIEVNATDLKGEENNALALHSGNFSISPITGVAKPECDINENTATRMNITSGNYVSIASANITKGNFTINDGTSQEQLYVCLTFAGSELSKQAYSTKEGGAWTIRILLAVLVIGSGAGRKRKQKKKQNEKQEIKERAEDNKFKDDKLIKALSLIIDELREKYSLSKAETMNIIVKELKEKYSLSKTELSKILEIRKEEKIPSTIFKKELGALEALCKYMKENLNMSYRKIAKELNRDERTIWASYKKAIEKHKSPLEISKTENYFDISIFKNRKLTILESAILYLRERRMKYKEIAKLLERDQRNIQTIYSRAVSKLKRNV